MRRAQGQTGPGVARGLAKRCPDTGWFRKVSTTPSPLLALFPCSRYLRERTHFTRVLMSSSFTLELGGIGTWPQTPTPPFFTLSTSLASAVASPAYFLATSLYAGPTSFLSMAWQAVQAFFLASSSLARAGAARTARPAARRMAGVFFMV